MDITDQAEQIAQKEWLKIELAKNANLHIFSGDNLPPEVREDMNQG